MERHIIKTKTEELTSDDKDPVVYGERFDTIVNNGFVALGIALGNKLGLFKTLTELSNPETSLTIAEHSGLQERYVREWLFSMVAAKIVFITDDDKYYIPRDCHDKTKSSLYATLLPAVAPLTDLLQQCFRSTVLSTKGYDFSRLGEVFNFTDQDRQNSDGKWIENNMLPSKIKNKDEIKQILDIGCGTGRITINLAKYFPDSHVIGIDIDNAAIDTAKKNKEDACVKNVDFFVLKGEELRVEWNDKFDWVTMLTVLHDLPNPAPCLQEVHRVMKQEGVLTVMDPPIHSDPRQNIGHKLHAASLIMSCYVCLPCSLSSDPAVGHGLSWGMENRAKYLVEKGFKVHDDKLASIIHCTINNLNS